MFLACISKTHMLILYDMGHSFTPEEQCLGICIIQNKDRHNFPDKKVMELHGMSDGRFNKKFNMGIFVMVT